MHNANVSIHVEDLGQVKKKLSITIPTDVVKKEFKAAYASLRTSASIPGFRKGATPMSILKNRFSAKVEEDVKVRLIETSYPQALQEKRLVPVIQPKIDVMSPLTENDPFSYAVTVEVNPEFDVDGYRGMALKKQPADVMEMDIEDAITRLREERADYQDAIRPAKADDAVVVDFEGFLDGEPVKNGKAAGYAIIIGQKTVLPGFDDALIGASAGENREFTLTIPENYSEGKLAGKAVLFKVNVKDVKEKIVPALDDEFAKDLGCENVAQLREKAASEIKKVKENMEKERLKNVVLDRLLEAHKFDAPDALVKKYVALNLNKVMEDMKRGAIAQADRQLSPDELTTKYTNLSIRQVREDILLDAIAAKESVKITKDQLDGALAHLGAMRGASVDEIAGRLEREGTLPVVVDGLKHEKVFDIIFETAKYE
ncbi:MAG: trigger factor [Deltaproteobacteria bacterium]|nr:trigger factor [Deltaproteobacteria bacterium]